MRLKLHFLSLAISIFFILLAVATGSGPESINAKRTETTVSLTEGYLHSCSLKNYENSKKDLQVSIVVEAVDFSGRKLNATRTSIRNVSNDDSLEKNYLFKNIKFPEVGYCVISVTVGSSDRYNCCGLLNQPTNKYRPYYVGSSPLMGVGDIPETIQIKPSFIHCY